MDVEMHAPEMSEVQQQQKENEAELEMTINQKLMEDNQNLNIQMEKMECDFSAEIEVFIVNNIFILFYLI